MTWQILQGDARQIPLADESVQCVVTSPPYYGLRDYGVAGQIGLASSISEHLSTLATVFAEVWRVLREDGTLWLNLGDSYAGSWGNYHPHSPPGKHGQRLQQTARWNRPAYASQDFLPPTANLAGIKPKNLIGMPWRVALMLQEAGWYLRSDIIWHKPNPMPESVQDRVTRSHEYVFLLTKSEHYWYDAEAIKEPPAGTGKGSRRVFRGGGSYTGRNSFNNSSVRGNSIAGNTQEQPLSRNARSVWTIATEACSSAHFATFPTALVERCIKAGCPKGGIVFDPFAGAGTVPLVADRLERRGIGLELNPAYCQMAHQRIACEMPLFAQKESR